MEEKLIDLMWEVKEGEKHPNKAYKELCILFNVSKCVHPYKNLSSGDNGLHCDKCQQFIATDSHIR